MANNNGVPLGSLTYSSIIDGGGWSTRGWACDDGTMFTGGDGTQAKIFKPGDTQWRQWFNPNTNFNLSTSGITLATGTFDIAACDTDSTHSYWLSGYDGSNGGYLFATTNTAQTVTKTNFPQSVNALQNENLRMTGKPVAVDPINNQVVWIGIAVQGFSYTTNGGSTWNNVSTATLPAPVVLYQLGYASGTSGFTQGQTITGGTSGATATVAGLASGSATASGAVIIYGITGTFQSGEALKVSGTTYATSNGTPSVYSNSRADIQFDRHSAQSGGLTQGIYAFINGHGLYHSTNAGSTWASVSGAPTFASHMAVSKYDGSVHLCGSGWNTVSGQYYMYNGSTWTAPSGVISKSISIHPSTSGLIYLVADGGGVSCSTNNGTSFNGPSTSNNRIGVNIPWLANTNEAYMSNGCSHFNRLTGDLWYFEGIGTWKYISPATTIPSTLPWTENATGIPSLTGVLAKVNRRGDYLYSCYDRTGFYIPRAQIGVVQPSNQMLTNGFQLGQDSDFSWSDDNFMVAVILQGNGPVVSKPSGFTTNAGQTWASFPTDITTVTGNYGGGNIVALSDTILLQQETNGGFLMRSPDCGQTWTRCLIGNNLAYSQIHHAYYLFRRILVKDLYIQGHAFLYSCGDTTGSANDIACRGIWETLDYGVTWTRVYNNSIGASYGADAFSGQLVQLGPTEWAWNGDSSGLHYSSNNMRAWASDASTDNTTSATSWTYCNGIGSGPGIASGSKCYWAVGARGGQFGYWYCGTDPAVAGSEWLLEGVYPGGYYYSPQLAVDPIAFGMLNANGSPEGCSRIALVDQRLQS